MHNQPEVMLLGVEYDKTSSFRKGADKGPRAVLHCFDTQLELFDRYSGWEPSHHLSIGKTILSEVKELSPEQMIKSVSERVFSNISNKIFTIVVGGEHTVTTGVLSAWRNSPFKDKITVVQIDAHLDLRDTDADYAKNPSRFSHSCVMKRALDFGFRILPIGVRAYSNEERRTALKHKVHYVEWPQPETAQTIKDIIASIETEFVYLTIDIDGIDPSVMPGTGTPVQGGLNWYFCIELIKELFDKKEVVGADVVEVCPQPDDPRTEYGAAQLCYSMIGFKFKGSPKQA